jgi:hypothetical protein
MLTKLSAVNRRQDLIDKMDALGSKSGKPAKIVKIARSGQLLDGSSSSSEL